MPVLQFKGKTAIESYHHSVPHHTLEFDGKLSVLGKGEKPGLDGNLIIEGDNLLALKSLLPTHAGRIKCIYIDPPYNTGNEGWVYNDNLTQPQFKEWIGQVVGKEGEDATRHDKWCCMMYPRLQLLKELLCDDGLIFVSIDYVEVANLRMLMDEIFGPDNFLADAAWEKRYTRSNNAKLFYSLKDTIMVYRKSGAVDFLRESRTEKSNAIYRNPDNHPRGPWTSSSYVNPATKAQRPNLVYKIQNPFTREMVEHETHAWKYEPDTHKQHVAENRLWWGEDGHAKYPRLKVFKSEEGIVPIDIWHYQTTGTSDDGGNTIKEIFGSLVFDNPKPVGLVRRMLDLATRTDKGDIVLDCFAGSGTTAHAVLEQNTYDGGNRLFILVQQRHDTKEQEKTNFNVCQNITAERVRRVMQGYKFEGTKTETLLEEKLTLTTFKNADELLERIEQIKEQSTGKFDEIKTECKDGIVRVLGIKKVKSKSEGLGGTFTYARVGAPLFGEYRDFGKKLPAYEELAKYIFYTETSRDFDRKTMNEKTGKIGEHSGTSYYLLYTPNGQEDRQLDLPWLETLQKTDKNRSVVVYCEKIHVHRDDLAKYEQETKRTVRPMVVPFSLK